MKNHIQIQEEHDRINIFITHTLKKANLNPYMDRGSIKYEKNDKLYRYKIKDRVIRKELQITLSGGQYSKPKKEWILIRSYSYIKILKKAKDPAWKSEVKST